MQINAPAIEFIAFIAVAAWLVFIGPKTTRSERRGEESAEDPGADDDQDTKPPDRP